MRLFCELQVDLAKESFGKGKAVLRQFTTLQATKMEYDVSMSFVAFPDATDAFIVELAKKSGYTEKNQSYATKCKIVPKILNFVSAPVEGITTECQVTRQDLHVTVWYDETKLSSVLDALLQCTLPKALDFTHTIPFQTQRYNAGPSVFPSVCPSYTLSDANCALLQNEAPNLNLLSYQCAGVAWMLWCEERSIADRCADSVKIRVSHTDQYRRFMHPGFRPYESVYGGLLLDEAGLGKTIQTIALITVTLPKAREWRIRLQTGGRTRASTTLVIVPPVLIPQWKSEVNKWSPNMSVAVFGKKMNIECAVENDVLLLSMSLCGRSRELQLLCKHYEFYRVVIDEAHLWDSSWKNAAQRALFARDMLQGPNRWGLTATPEMDLGTTFLSVLRDRRRFPTLRRQAVKWNNGHFGNPFRVQSVAPGTWLGWTLFCVASLRRTREMAIVQKANENVRPVTERVYDVVWPTEEHRLCMEHVLTWAQLECARSNCTSFQKQVVVQQVVRTASHSPALLSEKRLRKFGCLATLVAPDDEPSRDTRIKDVHVAYLNDHPDCALCLDVVDEPTAVSKCMHVFCYGCITSMPAPPHGGLKCPLCRVKFAFTDIVPFQPRVRHSSGRCGDETRLAPNAATKAAFDTLLQTSTPVFPRVDAMLDIVRGIPAAEQCVVFTAVAAAIDSVLAALKKADIPHACVRGSTSASQRREAFNKLYDGRARVFVLGIRSGAVGLNLTRANHLIFLEKQNSAATREQAIGRVQRIGQTRPVYVHTLHMPQTIDDPDVTQLFT